MPSILLNQSMIASTNYCYGGGEEVEEESIDEHNHFLLAGPSNRASQKE